MSKSQIPHDSSYRRLFSHAVMVEDLLRRYVAPAWIDRLDFTTLERVPARYVSEELEQRESDVVWRLRYRPGDDWFYVYILIEFQSTVSRFMAIRVLVYMMLLYEDLIRRKQLTQSRKLPLWCRSCSTMESGHGQRRFRSRTSSSLCQASSDICPDSRFG